MLVPIRIDRTSKPPLGTPLRSDGHWSVQGLAGGWAFNEGAGGIALNSLNNSTSSLSSATWLPSGLNCGTTAEAKYVNITTPSIINLPLSPFTVIAACKPNYTRSGSNNAVIAWGGTDDLLVMPNDGTAVGTRIFWRDCGGNTNGSHLESKDTDIVIGFTAKSGVQQIYHNGLPIGTPNSNDLSLAGPFTTCRIGSWADGAGEFGGIISWLFLFSRALSPAEIASLSANPWQIYEPEIVWVEVGGGGELSLSISNAIHTQLAEGFGLTQNHLLALQNAIHAQSSGNVVLTQVHSISVQDGLHTQTSDNLTLQQNHILATLNASHAHTSSNLALQQQHLLAVNNALHAHSADNISFDEAIQLVIQGAVHGLTSQALALQQVHQLVTQSALHGHIVGNVQLQQIHNIIVAGTQHTLSSGNLTLNVEYLLGIANAQHGHTAEGITLTQAHQVAIQNAVHAVVSSNIALSQNHTLIVSDALHQMIAANVHLINGVITTPDARVFMVLAQNRIFVIAKEERSFIVK